MRVPIYNIILDLDATVRGLVIKQIGENLEASMSAQTVYKQSTDGSCMIDSTAVWPRARDYSTEPPEIRKSFET